MITKDRLIKHISKLPEQISIDELIDKLVFIDKLETRIQQSNNDETISEEQFEKEMEEWFK